MAYDCGEKSDNVKHTYEEWLTTKDATETAEGSRERSYEVCGFKQTENMPKLAQSSESETATPAVDDDDNETDTTNPLDATATADENTNVAAGDRPGVISFSTLFIPLFYYVYIKWGKV